MDPVHLENSTDPRKTVDFMHTFLSTVATVFQLKCFGNQDPKLKGGSLVPGLESSIVGRPPVVGKNRLPVGSGHGNKHRDKVFTS